MFRIDELDQKSLTMKHSFSAFYNTYTTFWEQLHLHPKYSYIDNISPSGRHAQALSLWYKVYFKRILQNWGLFVCFCDPVSSWEITCV